MMNYKKILNDIVKDYLSQKLKGDYSTYSYGSYKGKVVIMPDKFRLILIEAHLFPFDLCRLNKGLTESMLKAMLDNLHEYDFAKLTGDKKDVHLNGKIGKMATVVKIANDHDHAWVNEEYLKIYDKDSLFKISTKDRPHLKPVLVLDGNNVDTDLTGLVLPVRMSEDKERGV